MYSLLSGGVSELLELGLVLRVDGGVLDCGVEEPLEELYSRAKKIKRQCKLTQSQTTISEYPRQLS